MRSFAVVLAVMGLVASQQIIPSSVPKATRDSWCSDQKSSCPLICTQTTNSQTTLSNTCNPDNLAWTCVCNNGQTPAVANYSLTIPFHECQEFGNQCVTACGQNNNQCANDCRVNNPCGALSPKPVNATSSSSTSASATGSSSTSTASNFASFGGSGGNNGGSNKNGASAYLVQGGSIVVAGIFAGFCLML